MRWSYKTIHYELKKDGLLGSAFLDEPEIELSLNQYGKAGWELISLIETMDGLMAVFKQPLDLDTRPFSLPSESSERIGRSSKGLENKTKVFESKLPREKELETQGEDVAEAMLLDEFEVVEDKIEEAVAKPSPSPVDVGLIRIE